MKGIPQGGLAWTVGKLFFNRLNMPCVELADDADPDEDEMPLNAKITGKKTAKIVDHKDYKKAVIMNAKVKVRKITSIESNDKM